MPAKEFENMGVLQAKVMDALWDLGEGTVHQIRTNWQKWTRISPTPRSYPPCKN